MRLSLHKNLYELPPYIRKLPFSHQPRIKKIWLRNFKNIKIFILHRFAAFVRCRCRLQVSRLKMLADQLYPVHFLLYADILLHLLGYQNACHVCKENWISYCKIVRALVLNKLKLPIKRQIIFLLYHSKHS